MLKILFITAASHTPSDKNLNHFQRTYFLSRHTDLTILACKGSTFDASVKPGTKVINAPFKGKGGAILFGIFWPIFSRSKTYDIILTDPTVLGILGFFYKLLKRGKWVVDIWDIPIRCALYESLITQIRCRIIQLLIINLYRFADLFIISILPNFQLKKFNLPENKMRLFSNAIWLNHKGNQNVKIVDSNRFHILCMRTVYTRNMGLDTLAQAFLILQNKIFNLKLTVIGRIPPHVLSQVNHLKNLSDVEFIEFVNHDDLQHIISSASVAAVPFKDVPDLAQTYPVKILEYLSLGQIIIASSIEGLRRMIEHGKNGLLFRAGHAEDLADKIMQIYKNKKLQSTISANARVLDENHNCVYKNKKIIKELHKLAKRI